MKRLVFIMLSVLSLASCNNKVNTYTVFFDSNGGAFVPQQTIEEGGTASAPENPTKQGYVFLFWHLSDAVTAYDFQTPVNSNITLVAKWEDETKVEYWQVAWNLNGGSWPPNSNHATQVVKGGTLAEPNEPVKPSADSFDGWYKEAALTNKVTFPYDVSGVTANITLYAKWSNETPPAEITVQGSSLAAKLLWIKDNVASNTIYTFEVNADENIDPQDFRFSGKTSITVRLKGIGGERSISYSPSTRGAMFLVRDGVTLVLDENIDLVGNNYPVNVNSLVGVYGGTLIMNQGATIRNNHVRSNSAQGGGVRVVEGGNFIMNGGTIKGNSTTGYGATEVVTRGWSYGGGVSVTDGTFTMNDGSIEGNSVGYDYSGRIEADFVYGGGVGISNGTFIMLGGTIKNNTVSTIGGNGGGGVGLYNNSIFTMNDGSIENNTSTSSNDISGGGIYSQSSTFFMKGGTIKGNIATTANRATDCETFGGGVYLVDRGIFEKTGGTIYGYTEGDSNSNVTINTNTLNPYRPSPPVPSIIFTDKGSAIYAVNGGRRETTSGPDDILSYNGVSQPPTVSGDWDE